MFDRMQKQFLTVETGEAYQPIRLMYHVMQKDELIKTLDNLQCIQKNVTPNSWTWYWKAECDDVHFESLPSFRKHPDHPVRLGTINLRDDKLYFHLPSFKRACLTIPFFYKVITQSIAVLQQADFINKVFAIDERMPHGFTELFNDQELDKVLNQRLEDYHRVKEQCEEAETVEKALDILSEYTEHEAKKRLPYAERYQFEAISEQDADVIFLAFYIFLHGRELVAIKRWFGQIGYSLVDATEEMIQSVFGEMNIEFLE